MNFMIHPRKRNTESAAEPEAGRPAGSGEEWLGRNRSSKRKLWERSESAESEANSRDSRGAGAAADTCTIAGAIAREAERGGR